MKLRLETKRVDGKLVIIGRPYALKQFSKPLQDGPSGRLQAILARLRAWIGETYAKV